MEPDLEQARNKSILRPVDESTNTSKKAVATSKDLNIKGKNDREKKNIITSIPQMGPEIL